MEMEIENTNSIDVSSSKFSFPEFWSDGHDGRLKGPHMDGRPSLFPDQQGRVIKLISWRKEFGFVFRLVNIDSSE